jgi:hypothetical protein
MCRNRIGRKNCLTKVACAAIADNDNLFECWTLIALLRLVGGNALSLLSVWQGPDRTSGA